MRHQNPALIDGTGPASCVLHTGNPMGIHLAAVVVLMEALIMIHRMIIFRVPGVIDVHDTRSQELMAVRAKLAKRSNLLTEGANQLVVQLILIVDVLARCPVFMDPVQEVFPRP